MEYLLEERSTIRLDYYPVQLQTGTEEEVSSSRARCYPSNSTNVKTYHSAVHLFGGERRLLLSQWLGVYILLSRERRSLRGTICMQRSKTHRSAKVKSTRATRTIPICPPSRRSGVAKTRSQLRDRAAIQQAVSAIYIGAVPKTQRIHDLRLLELGM